MPPTPLHIEADRNQRVLRITWADGSAIATPFWEIRCDCRCAHCVDEVTGAKLLDPKTVPSDISIDKAELVGNYALRIRWTDGHDTGLFTWDHLQAIGNT